MGYRIRLLKANFDADISDGNLDGTITLRNDGFGKVFNPRKLEVVFRHTQTGAEFVLPMPQDPRFWSPGLEQTLVIQIPIPKSIPFGSYSLYLSLQDPAPSLYGMPEYAIRLANEGLWQASKGYNALNHTVKVSSFNPNAIRVPKQGSPKNSFGISKRKNVPSRGAIGIELVLARPSDIQLDVYDMKGEWIVQIAQGQRPAGFYSFLWKGDDGAGNLRSQGVYLIRLRSGGKQESRQVFLER